MLNVYFLYNYGQYVNFDKEEEMKYREMIYKMSRFYNIVKNEGFMSGMKKIKRHKMFKKVKEAFLLSYVKLQASNGLFLKTVQGSKMYLDLSDPGISKELLLTGVHEKRTTDLIKNELEEGMIVVDIGSNLGYYCLLEALIVGNQGKVYALEPVPKNFKILSKNININSYKNIKSYCLAVSDKSGTADFFLTAASNWGSMIDLNSENTSEYMKGKMEQLNRGVIKVKTVSIDDFLKKENVHNVNLIRMDIEGHEINAIKGMEKTLKSNSSPIKLLIEVHNKLFNNLEKSLTPTFEKLLLFGFKPKVLIAKKDLFHNIKNEEFIRILCSYKTICCHLLMEK